MTHSGRGVSLAAALVLAVGVGLATPEASHARGPQQGFGRGLDQLGDVMQVVQQRPVGQQVGKRGPGRNRLERDDLPANPLSQVGGNCGKGTVASGKGESRDDDAQVLAQVRFNEQIARARTNIQDVHLMGAGRLNDGFALSKDQPRCGFGSGAEALARTVGQETDNIVGRSFTRGGNKPATVEAVVKMQPKGKEARQNPPAIGKEQGQDFTPQMPIPQPICNAPPAQGKAPGQNPVACEMKPRPVNIPVVRATPQIRRIPQPMTGGCFPGWQVGIRKPQQPVINRTGLTGNIGRGMGYPTPIVGQVGGRMGQTIVRNPVVQKPYPTVPVLIPPKPITTVPQMTVVRKPMPTYPPVVQKPYPTTTPVMTRKPGPQQTTCIPGLKPTVPFVQQQHCIPALKPTVPFVQQQNRNVPLTPTVPFVQQQQPMSPLKPTVPFVQQQNCIPALRPTVPFVQQQRPMSPLKPTVPFVQQNCTVSLRPTVPYVQQQRPISPLQPSVPYLQQQRPNAPLRPTVSVVQQQRPNTSLRPTVPYVQQSRTRQNLTFPVSVQRSPVPNGGSSVGRTVGRNSPCGCKNSRR